MIRIDLTEIISWGRIYSSKGDLPKLISRLIMETTPRSTEFNIPSGSGVFLDSWDGIVKCYEETNFVPKGISLWEMGANGQKTKADHDYNTRTADSLGFDKSQCTYIFVTTATWKKKDAWDKAKNAEGQWKEVRVLDASMIAQWLELSLVSSRWFSAFYYNRVFDEMYGAEDYWTMIAKGPAGIVLEPEVVTAGREHEIQALVKFLEGSPGLKAIRGATKDEAVAFILAAAQRFYEVKRQVFFSKTLVVERKADFQAARHNRHGINIIARQDDISSVYSAAGEHHVLVPLGADDEFDSAAVVILPRIDRDGQIQALCKMSYSREESERLSRDAARDFTILKKFLGYPPVKNKWLQEAIDELIPAMLVGRWNESNAADKLVLEALAGEPYEAYAAKLAKWLTVEGPPLIKMSSGWRLTSPWDIWTILGGRISQDILENFKAIFLSVFSRTALRPSMSLVERLRAGESANCSAQIREGLAQTLIMIVIHEGNTTHHRAQREMWGEQIVTKLIGNATGELWESVNRELPLIAEASPRAFLSSVDSAIKANDRPILRMFVEHDDPLGPTSNHTGLLWALESLAWTPEYFLESVLLLARLSTLDPGGKLVNRPINSLREIFKPWHPQTLASTEERNAAVTALFTLDPTIGWTVAFSMLPENHAVAYPTHKARWRRPEKSFDHVALRAETTRVHSEILNLLIGHAKKNDAKIAQLVTQSDNLSIGDRQILFNHILVEKEHLKSQGNETWHALQRILTEHRRFPSASWALNEVELAKYEVLHKELQPKDVRAKAVWSFSDPWPLPPDGPRQYKMSYEEEEQLVHDTRVAALKTMYDKLGLDRTLAAIPDIKEHIEFGAALAEFVVDEMEILKVVSTIKEKIQQKDWVVLSFLHRKINKLGMKWLLQRFDTFKAVLVADELVAKILLPLPQNLESWIFVDNEGEVQHEYWKQLQPLFWQLPIDQRLYGIDKLIGIGRLTSAINVLYYGVKDIPSQKIMELLLYLGSRENHDEKYPAHYVIEKLFEVIEERPDVSDKDRMTLEWRYLPLLASYGSSYKPKLLHTQLAQDPMFFMELVLGMSKSEKDEDERQMDQRTDEERENWAQGGAHLLGSWKQPPGLNQDGSINNEQLTKWIDTVRRLAAERHRLTFTDMLIGQVLAHFPETNEPWPPKEVADLIDQLNSDVINRNFSAAAFNKRGSSVRGVFDGGQIERDHEAYFRRQAQVYRDRPVTCGILERLANGYSLDAQRQDEQAEWDKLDT